MNVALGSMCRVLSGKRMAAFYGGLHFVVAALAATVSASAQAAWTDVLSIKIVKAQANGTHLRLNGFVNNDSSISCGSNEFFLLSTEPNYKERTAFLLAAFISGKPVRVSYYDCSSGHIRLGSVQFE